MIADKLTWSKAQTAVVQLPAPPPTTKAIASLDFTNPGLRWVDDPNGKKLTVQFPSVVPALQIMGDGTETPYNADWSEQDARAALLKQMGLAMPDPTPAPVPPAPAVTPAATVVAAATAAVPVPASTVVPATGVTH